MLADLLFFAALVLGAVGGFALWAYSGNKRSKLIRSWRRKREKND